MHAASHEVEVMEGREGEVDKVDGRRRFEKSRDLLGVVEGDAAPRRHLIRAEAYADREVFPDRLPDAPEKLKGKAHAVLEGSSVLIGPKIREGRHKLPRERAVAKLKLYPV